LRHPQKKKLRLKKRKKYERRVPTREQKDKESFLKRYGGKHTFNLQGEEARGLSMASKRKIDLARLVGVLGKSATRKG